MDSHNIDRIVPFCISEEEARQKLAWELAKCDLVPIDVFDNLSISTNKVYYPLWVFCGSFKAPWSCLKTIRNKNFHIHNINHNINPERSTDYYPVNGVAVGDFEFAISATTKSKLFLQDGVSYYEEYNPLKVSKDEIQYDIDISSEEAWDNDKTQKHIERIVKAQLDLQIPHEYTDLNCHIEYLHKDSYNVLYPIMNMTYHYKGKNYSCKVDGYGNFLSFNHPTEYRQNNTEKSEEIELKNPINISKFGWTCFGVFILNSILTICSLESKLPVMAVLSSLLMVFAFIWGFKMSFRKDAEKVARKEIGKFQNKVKGKFHQDLHEQRMRELANANIPLLEPHRAEMQKNSKDVSVYVAEYSTKAKEYNSLIRRDEIRLLKYYAVMLSITLLVIIALFIHYLNTHSL